MLFVPCWFELDRKQNELKREIVTCSKCFPTAWEFALVWPVARVSTFMDLEKNERVPKMRSKTRRKENSVGKSS